MAKTKSGHLILPPLLAIIVIAWGTLFFLNELMNSHQPGMWMPPSGASSWQIKDFALVYSMWAVMMTAMMLPSAAPVIRTFANVCLQHDAKPYRSIGIFIFGYLMVWLLFSAGLSLLQRQFHALAWLSPMMESQSNLLSGSILVLAGAYQLTPVKNACLKHCRTPFGFIVNHWQKGAFGAFQMGFKHGITCLGCCWAVMLIMFSVGVMNLLGMALITLLVATEKTLPSKFGFFRVVTGLVFIGWGCTIVLL